VFSGPIQKGTASTNSTGDYSIANLHPGTFTVQAVNVGNRTKEQSAAVNENTTTTANLSLDLEPAGPVLYAYDAIGRLVQVTDPSGDAAIYRYDAVGNITAIARTGTTTVSVSGFTPTSGAIGSSVTISGTGFSATPGQNTVTFACTGTGCTVQATVTSATATQLVVTVPATAITSVIAVAAQGQTANAPGSFTVTTAGAAPTITGFTPTLTVAGSTLTVTGTNFDSTPANDRLTANVASAQVTSAAPTSLQATVPVTTTGRVSVLTQNGTATSTDYLWVAPAPYAVTDVETTGSITFGAATSIPVNSAGKIAMRAFDSTQGHRASVSVTNATFAAGGSVAIYGVYANPTSTGFASTGFLEPVDLHETGTYTFILAPNSPSTGSATVTVYDVPPDVTGPIVPGGSGVPVSLTVPGQNARLTFTGTANNRVCATTTIATPPDPVISSGSLKLLNPDSSPLGSTGFNSAVPAFLDARTLPSSGTYTVVVDPDTTSTGSTTVNLYSVPADFTGSVTINGSSLPVPLSTCQNGSVTFSGTQNQQATVHVTGNTFATVTVKLLSSDGQTVLSQFTSGAASFDLAPATLPTPGTATYTITIDPSTTAAGTLNVSVSGS
jgi:YD repeat-containing protein